MILLTLIDKARQKWRAFYFETISYFTCVGVRVFLRENFVVLVYSLCVNSCAIRVVGIT